MSLLQRVIDFGLFRIKDPDQKNSLAADIQYNPETQYPVIRASICTGEKVAGFKEKNGSHFTEVMVIRTPDDLAKFKAAYGVEQVKTEY